MKALESSSALFRRSLYAQNSLINMPCYDPNLFAHPESLPVCLVHHFGSGSATTSEESSEFSASASTVSTDNGLFAPARKTIQMRSASLGRGSSSNATSAYALPGGLLRKLEANKKAPLPMHVFVLHHGYNGTSFDMRLFRSYLLLLFGPQVLVLNSTANEEDSETSIATMGSRLALDVRRYIMSKCPQLANPTDQSRISFVGHSAGSIIIRAALASPLLAVYKAKMHVFLSLSSPHLGTTYVPSAIVATGMWALKRLRKTELLDELQMQDAPVVEDCFMYKLSTDGGLGDFKHTIPVSGHQDQYVPLHSAQINVPVDAERDMHGGGPALISMAANLVGSMDPSRVIRVNLDHVFPRTTLDTIIGRAAHVSILDSQATVQLLVFSLYDYLKPANPIAGGVPG